MAKDKKLGTGLQAIFGADYDSIIDSIDAIQADPEQAGKATEIDIETVYPNPYQPRKIFNEEALQELADSIKEHGVFTPILVKKTDTGYVLIAGERRLRASKMAGLSTIPALIQEFTDQQMMEISLLENIQREDLSAIEEANSFNSLMQQFGYTQEQLAEHVHKTRVYVANTLRLLKLPTSVQQKVSDKVLTMGQVRPLITLDNPEKIVELAEKIEKEGLSVRQVEKLIQDMKKPPVQGSIKLVDPQLQNVQQIIQSRLQTTVSVSDKEIRIKYTDVKDLNRILEMMHCLDD